MKIPNVRQLPSGAYFCQVRMIGQSKTFIGPTEKSVIAQVMAYKMDIDKLKKAPRDITLSEAIDEYIAERDNIISPSTVRGYKQIQENRFQSIMHLRISKLDKSKLQRAINEDMAPNEKGEVKSPKTILNGYSLVRAVLGNGTGIDFSKITLPQKDIPKSYKLTRNQILTLMEAIEGMVIEIPVLLALWLSLRRSEILGLTWDCIDFESGVLAVRRARVFNEKNELVIKKTKTPKSARKIPLPPYISDKLKRLRGDVYIGGARIFAINPSALHHRILKVCEENNLPAAGLHYLRHVNASVMKGLNVPDIYAQSRGGWSSDYTYKHTYAETMDEFELDATKNIDGYFESVVDEKEAKAEK